KGYIYPCGESGKNRIHPPWPDTARTDRASEPQLVLGAAGRLRALDALAARESRQSSPRDVLIQAAGFGHPHYSERPRGGLQRRDDLALILGRRYAAPRLLGPSVGRRVVLQQVPHLALQAGR